MNPIKPDIRCAVINTTFEYGITPSINSGFNLTANVHDLKINVTNFKPLFNSETKTAKVNEHFQKLVPYVEMV